MRMPFRADTLDQRVHVHRIGNVIDVRDDRGAHHGEMRVPARCRNRVLGFHLAAAIGANAVSAAIFGLHVMAGRQASRVLVHFGLRRRPIDGDAAGEHDAADAGGFSRCGERRRGLDIDALHPVNAPDFGAEMDDRIAALDMVCEIDGLAPVMKAPRHIAVSLASHRTVGAGGQRNNRMALFEQLADNMLADLSRRACDQDAPGWA